MRNLKLLMVAGLMLAAFVSAVPAQAVDVGAVNYTMDRNGKVGSIVNTSMFTNEAVTTGSGSVSATCPAPANKILFQPADSGGNFRTKPNGSGAPTGAAVSDGSGWQKNWADWLDINTIVSGTLISSYAVYTKTADVVPYTCGAK